jgi:hypothetical protein
VDTGTRFSPDNGAVKEVPSLSPDILMLKELINEPEKYFGYDLDHRRRADPIWNNPAQVRYQHLT